tara:strand:- start:32766 stop:32933 length:168 start_codon:yes stop_codon:yes gene_type:complete
VLLLLKKSRLFFKIEDLNSNHIMGKTLIISIKKNSLLAFKNRVLPLLKGDSLSLF